jgi:nitroimidazol reductase NimA-like FMN-containing flavoprotein (pyridoxamine 5'-phosphate oxidase superfamily)
MFEEMKRLVREKNICVLATIAGNKPYCSLMAYAADDACTEIYMATHRNTRKFRNLTENRSVSLLIDTRDAAPRSRAWALTIEGTCALVVDAAKREAARHHLLSRNSHLEEFLAHPENEVLCVSIHSLLLLKGLTDAHHLTLKKTDPAPH